MTFFLYPQNGQGFPPCSFPSYFRTDISSSQHNCDEILRPERDSVPAVIEVISDRGRHGLRCPVDHDVGEQFILAETALHVAIAVTPARNFSTIQAANPTGESFSP
jgi:hypothetical protein